MKLALALSAVLGVLSTRVECFVSSGGSALACGARSNTLATNGAFVQPIPSRCVATAERRGRSGDLGMSTVVIPSDFKLPIGIAAFGLAITGLGNVGAGFPISVVGLLLAFQATRVKFEFDDVAMEVKIGETPDELESSGENAFVGGESRWNYDTWTNWEVYPSEKLPILMYFKETQTKPEGQIHFFPFIMEPDVLLQEVRARVPQVVK
ncbi:unnamed protein product [Ectocarpus sp. 6 AP-2014]